MRKLFILCLLFFFNLPLFSQPTLTQFGTDVFTSTYYYGLAGEHAISGDGLTVVKGTPIYPNTQGIGMVRVFKYTSSNWTQLGSQINGEVDGEEFGDGVGISDDGLTIAIGGWKKTTALGWGTGYVKIYRLISGNWTQIGNSLFGQNGNENFGRKISLSNDGNTVAISGATLARIFNYSSGNWTQIGSYIPNISSNPYNNYATLNLCLSSNGTRLAVMTSNNGVCIYDLIAGQWVLTKNFILYTGYDSFSLSGDGNTITIGCDFSFFVFKNYGGNNWQFSYGENLSTIGSGVYVSTSSDGNTIAIFDIYNTVVKIYRFMDDTWTYFAQVPLSYGRINLSSDRTKVSTLSIAGNLKTLKVYDITPLLGIESLNLTSFSVYPNPAKNEINIKLDGNSIIEKVNLYNLLGQKIYETNNSILDISAYQKGCYLLEVITNNGRSTKKVILE